ncbi:MAG: DMT family transporter [Patescibacteria group bacterium]|jgi:drug/metabolite transporter (DMT)-like permease
MSWFTLAVISTLSLSVSVLYLRVTMKEEDSNPIASSIFFQFTLAFIIMIYALYQGFVIPPLSLWPRYLFSAVLYGTGTYLGFTAAKKIGASELTIVSTIGSVVSIVLGVFLLHELFGFSRFIGAVLILGSIIYLYTGKKLHFSNGAWYAIGSAVLYALAGVNDMYVIRVYDPVSYVALMSFLPGVILSVAKPRALLQLKELLIPKTLKNMLSYCFFYSIQAITYYLALSKGAGVSQMAPITRSEIVLVVLFSAIFLGERKNMKKKLVATTLVTMGVLLLA